MSIKDINHEVILKLSKGEEKSFSLLYDCYYTYLNSVALFYIFDRQIANEIVNDVFVNIWHKRATLVYPIHSYLVQSVKNGCLNNIRAQKTNDRVLNNHRLQLLDFQEEYILSNPTPLQYVETQEIEKQVLDAIDQLPEKCQVIFKQYIFSAKSPEDIAAELMLSVSTVRVQIKNALDKLKVSLNHLISLLILLLLR
ncbi:MAG TPA: RNA polymerase sigma-70 factor [Paludibacter sp.]|nr:RNA polymerase sigma-70 factor [Paludibacter sp.]